MSLWMIPFFLFWGAVEQVASRMHVIAPFVGLVIGVLCVGAAVISVILLVVAARVLTRSRRTGVRVIGWVLLSVEIVASIAFSALGAIAFVAVAVFA